VAALEHSAARTESAALGRLDLALASGEAVSLRAAWTEIARSAGRDDAREGALRLLADDDARRAVAASFPESAFFDVIRAVEPTAVDDGSPIRTDTPVADAIRVPPADAPIRTDTPVADAMRVPPADARSEPLGEARSDPSSEVSSEVSSEPTSEALETALPRL